MYWKTPSFCRCTGKCTGILYNPFAYFFYLKLFEMRVLGILDVRKFKNFSHFHFRNVLIVNFSVPPDTVRGDPYRFHQTSSTIFL